MSSWMGFWGSRKNSREATKDAIVGLRQQVLMLEKREEFLQKKIDEELKKARANATSNKRLATAALRQKKAHENELDRIAGTRLQLETQANALESANLNAETMVAMKTGADALKGIHSTLKVEKVDQTMDAIREQMDHANEISEAISNPVGMAGQYDEDELNAELEALEQEELDDRLAGAERAPIHAPVSPTGVHTGPTITATAEEDDEEAQLRQLQAELAM
ncbi:putative late endosome to vacuole transport-related protein [Kockovaella imperatae]|uniref:Vacuolar-sorting protein SNF7 n=1 Tax=Kockovaella imperatae TaxID=4999 RepID=A0A1Y1U9D6_9TREE|nr:putative late endosome to vacuole transport-related protein [Kockovaella imperatae]ORX33705.1 putative late endosome to vacuole transport-related protein [Kockovaella imperatae]